MNICCSKVEQIVLKKYRKQEDTKFCIHFSVYAIRNAKEFELKKSTKKFKELLYLDKKNKKNN